MVVVVILLTLLMASVGVGCVFCYSSLMAVQRVREEQQRIYANAVLDTVVVQEDVDCGQFWRRQCALEAGQCLLAACGVMLLLNIGQGYLLLYAAKMVVSLLLVMAISLLYLAHAGRRDTVMSLQRVRRTGIRNDSENEPSEWALEGYGAWQVNGSIFVSVEGTCWSPTCHKEEYVIALNGKRKVIRIYPADEFRLRPM